MSCLVRLLRGPARVHDHDVVGDVRDDAEVVRDHDQRGARLLLQLQQQVEDLRLDGGVERGGRLVGDDQLRCQRERHRDHRPLPHAAGELVRVVVHPLPGLRDADPAQQLHGPLACLLLARPTCRARGSSPRSASRPGTAGAGWSAGPGRSPRSARRGPRAAGPRSAASRSVPSNIALPVISAPGVRPSRVWVSTVLPLPDSPTMPRVRPGSTLNDTPRTARTTPSAVGKLTVRSSPRAGPSLPPLATAHGQGKRDTDRGLPL